MSSGSTVTVTSCDSFQLSGVNVSVSITGVSDTPDGALRVSPGGALTVTVTSADGSRPSRKLNDPSEPSSTVSPSAATAGFTSRRGAGGSDPNASATVNRMRSTAQCGLPWSRSARADATHTKSSTSVTRAPPGVWCGILSTPDPSAGPGVAPAGNAGASGWHDGVLAVTVAVAADQAGFHSSRCGVLGSSGILSQGSAGAGQSPAHGVTPPLPSGEGERHRRHHHSTSV